MIRIGIVGTDSSHALAFSSLCNLINPVTKNYNYKDTRITHVFGLDKVETYRVAKEGLIPNIVTSVEDMIDQVDAVMILFRDGNLHIPYARLFLMANVPLWIDKPFAIVNQEAVDFIKQAQERGVLLTGGSTCRYNLDVLNLKKKLDSSELGVLVSAYINFPGDINSSYHGLHFYGPHLIEMIFAIFGYDIISVTSSSNQEELICIVKYKDKSIILNFNTQITDATCFLHGKKQSHIGTILINKDTYKAGFDQFIQMLVTKELPIPYKNLNSSIILIHGILESLKEKKEVFISL